MWARPASRTERRPAVDWWTVASLATIAVAGWVWALLQGIDSHYITFSDGVYSYIASEVAVHGPHVMYGHIVLSQPPVVVLLASALWRAQPGLAALRAGLAALGIITGLLTYAVARSTGMERRYATVAAVVAMAAPIRTEFGGLDGEILLTPLLLISMLVMGRTTSDPRVAAGGLGPAADDGPESLSQRMTATAPWVSIGFLGLLVGLGFLVKVTWVVYAAAIVVNAFRRWGPRGAAGVMVAAAATVVGGYGVLSMVFGWSPSAMAQQILFGESRSGLQVVLFPAIVLMAVVLWGPFIGLAMPALKRVDPVWRVVLVAGLVSLLFMLKQGTFVNILAPIEPLVAILAVAGAVDVWRRRRGYRRVLIVACSLWLVLHEASLSSAGSGQVMPVPLGAAIVEIHNNSAVESAAKAIDTYTAPDRPVFVNPLLALAAGRREVHDQADWFILRALSQGCTSGPGNRCDLWNGMKLAVRSGKVSAAGIDRNVASFDPSIRRLVLGSFPRRIFRSTKAPLLTSIYVPGPARR